MNARRGGLGRGLGALITSAPAPPASSGTPSVPEPPAPESPAPPPVTQDSVDLRPVEDAEPRVIGELRLVPIADIVPNPRQPRSDFDEGALNELSASIRAVGLLQPVVVREVAAVDGESRFELVMGERRWRASRLAELEELPAIVRTTADDALLRDALVENLHREQLNPLEEAAAYQQLLDDFGCTHDDLAGRVGRSRSHVTNTMRLLGLPPAVQRRVAAGVLTAGHARALLGIDDSHEQEGLAARIVAEGLSVRAVEELVAVGVGSPVRTGARPSRAELPELQDVAARLADRLETRVKVVMGRTKGQITVEFASVDDLDRIVSTMVAAGSDGRG